MISIEKARVYSDMDVDKLGVVKTALELAPKGTFLEVGVRRGGTSLMAINAPNCDFLICIDPYIGFNDMAGNPIEMDKNWYREALGLISDEAEKLDKDFIFHKMTSKEFMDLEDPDDKDFQYSYVLLDGDHTSENVQREINYFSKRMKKGGVLLQDNTDWTPEINYEGWEAPRFDMKYKIF